MDILTIETPSLGDRSYVVTDGTVAAVIDPQRDLDRVDAVIEEHDLTITHVLETHNHNDDVSGGVQLARQTGAADVISADEEMFVQTTGVRAGDRFAVGAFMVRALHTPGHTHRRTCRTS